MTSVMENKPETTVPDNRNIRFEDDIDLDYWSNEFGISKDELMQAVKAGETSAEAVERYVRRIEFAA